MPCFIINVKLVDYNVPKPQTKKKWSRQKQLIIYIVDDICIFVTIWEIHHRRSSCYWQLENTVLWELYAVAILAENDINIQAFRGKTPADHQLEIVYLPAERRN